MVIYIDLESTLTFRNTWTFDLVQTTFEFFCFKGSVYDFMIFQSFSGGAVEVWKWVSHTPRWYPKWCLTWWKPLSFGVTSRRCLLPCSVRGAGLFLPSWLWWWPLANITCFQVKSNDTLNMTRCSRVRKKNPFATWTSRCGHFRSCLQESGFLNAQIDVLMNSLFLDVFFLIRTVEAKNPWSADILFGPVEPPSETTRLMLRCTQELWHAIMNWI